MLTSIVASGGLASASPVQPKAPAPSTVTLDLNAAGQATLAGLGVTVTFGAPASVTGTTVTFPQQGAKVGRGIVTSTLGGTITLTGPTGSVVLSDLSTGAPTSVPCILAATDIPTPPNCVLILNNWTQERTRVTKRRGKVWVKTFTVKSTATVVSPYGVVAGILGDRIGALIPDGTELGTFTNTLVSTRTCKTKAACR